MSKIFEVDFRKGQWREYLNNLTPTNNGTKIKKAEYGMCARFAQTSDYLHYSKTLFGTE